MRNMLFDLAALAIILVACMFGLILRANGGAQFYAALTLFFAAGAFFFSLVAGAGVQVERMTWLCGLFAMISAAFAATATVSFIIWR